MTQDAHISFVLDKSSSMAHLTDSTIESFNKFMAEQRNVEGNAFISLTLFDTSFDVRYVGWNVNDVPEMDTTGPNAYVPNGSTALYDAVCIAIKGAEKWQANQGFTGKMIVVIQTDGEENSSQQWSLDAMNDLIKYKRGEGWEFIFLGTGQSAWLEAKKFTSIQADNKVNYSGTKGTHRQAYAATSAAVSGTRMTGQSVQVDQTWNDAKQD